MDRDDFHPLLCRVASDRHEHTCSCWSTEHTIGYKVWYLGLSLVYRWTGRGGGYFACLPSSVRVLCTGFAKSSSKLYKTLVRTRLEYCAHFWLPCYRKYVIKLERVDNGFTSMLLGLEGLGYWRDWICWGFFSQECRRLRGELMEVDQIMKGIDMVNTHSFYSQTRRI